MKILYVKQSSTEWLQARLGIVTASECDALVSPTFKIRTGQGHETYLHKKVCERLLGFSSNNGSSFAMDNGSILEHEAIPWFSFEYNLDVQRVGLCLTDDGKAGASPDGLIGEDGGIEIKCPSPEVHLGYMIANKVPEIYLTQLHMSLWVTGRKFWYFVSYSRQFQPMVLRVERDEEACDIIDLAVTKFNERMDAVCTQLTQKQALRINSGTRGD